MTITLPLPPPALSPNARGHWSRKASATKRYRILAWGLSCEQLPASQRHRWDRAEVRTTWYLPDRKRRDPDNLQASLKAAIDGLRDAGIIADDNALTIHAPTLRLDRANPRVVLEVQAHDGRVG